jgi:hypothetical protein
VVILIEDGLPVLNSFIIRLYTPACKATPLAAGSSELALNCASASRSVAQKHTFPSSHVSMVQYAYKSTVAFNTAPPNWSQNGETSVPPPPKLNLSGARQRINTRSPIPYVVRAAKAISADPV